MNAAASRLGLGGAMGEDYGRLNRVSTTRQLSRESTMPRLSREGTRGG